MAFHSLLSRPISLFIYCCLFLASYFFTFCIQSFVPIFIVKFHRDNMTHFSFVSPFLECSSFLHVFIFHIRKKFFPFFMHFLVVTVSSLSHSTKQIQQNTNQQSLENSNVDKSTSRGLRIISFSILSWGLHQLVWLSWTYNQTVDFLKNTPRKYGKC